MIYDGLPWFWLSVSLKVFVHGDELENYYKEFDAEILPSDFDGKGLKYDGKVTAAHLFDWALFIHHCTRMWQCVVLVVLSESELSSIDIFPFQTAILTG